MEDVSGPRPQTPQRDEPAEGSERSSGLAETRLACLQDAFFHMEQGLAVFGRDRRLILCNERFAALLALAGDVLVPGKTAYAEAIALVAAVVRADNGSEPSASLRKRLLDHAAGGAADRFEVPVAGGDWVQIDARPTASDGMVVTVTDITPLKRAEAQLRHETDRTRRQLQEAIEAISEGFVLYDAEDRLVLFNQRYRDEFSFAPEALVPGTTYAEILRRGVADSSARV